MALSRSDVIALMETANQAYRGVDSMPIFVAGSALGTLTPIEFFTDIQGSPDNSPEFDGTAFFDDETDSLVISFGGTEQKLNEIFTDDAALVLGNVPDQLDNAIYFAISVFGDFIGRGIDLSLLNIVFTGHSLGGALVFRV